MLGAGIIWVLVAIIAPDYGVDHEGVRIAVFHGLEEFASLLLFLLAAMTYIAALEERQVFATLRSKLVAAGMNMRQLFWATGVFAFLLSPIADNLTTALVLGAVVMAVGANDPKFILLACINIVNAANAGGAFSPFGDITTLMVWQAGYVDFFNFFPLFLPSLVCFLVPAKRFFDCIVTALKNDWRNQFKITCATGVTYSFSAIRCGFATRGLLPLLY